MLTTFEKMLTTYLGTNYLLPWNKLLTAFEYLLYEKAPTKKSAKRLTLLPMRSDVGIPTWSVSYVQ